VDQVLAIEEAARLRWPEGAGCGQWDPAKLAAIIDDIKDGVAEIHDALRILDVEIEACMEIIRSTHTPEDMPKQRRLLA
jgi:hypothetical protein